MSAAFIEKDLRNIYNSYNSEKQSYLDDIQKIILAKKGFIEGNAFYIDGTNQLLPELYTKQVNLFWCGKQATARICEIGFNAGHSTMLMLLGREKSALDFTIFDIGHHSYTKPCLMYIRSKFPEVNFEYIEGDSTLTMPVWISENNKYAGTYDVVHVDGGHSEHCISNDMKNADILVKVNGIIIIDDTNHSQINKYVDAYLEAGKYKELNVLTTIIYPHRVIQKVSL